MSYVISKIDIWQYNKNNTKIKEEIRGGLSFGRIKKEKIR